MYIVNSYIDESSKFPKTWTFEIQNLLCPVGPLSNNSSKLKLSIVLSRAENKSEKLECLICLIQHFEADFPQKVSLKLLNSGLILKTFTHVVR